MRFIHMADVHLGAAPDGKADWSEARKNEIWETFRSSIADARRENVDLLLIAGDLFHRQPLLEELREVNYLFSTLQNTRVVLIAGNHDYLQPASNYLNYPWSRNVACLFSRECECVRFSDIGTEVYGLSYYRQEIPEPLYEGIHPVQGREKCCRILLAHGGDSRHIPMDSAFMKRSGFDYLALGHIHKPQVVIPDLAAYAGALEPIDCLDTGPHGYILGEYRKGRIHFQFVKKAKREYISLALEVTETDTTFSLRDKLEKRIQEIKSVTAMLVEGMTPEEILQHILGDMDLEILDTLPAKFYCNCSADRVSKAIISVGKDEIKKMIDDGEPIEVNCHFCNSKYTFTVDELKEMYDCCTR